MTNVVRLDDHRGPHRMRCEARCERFRTIPYAQLLEIIADSMDQCGFTDANFGAVLTVTISKVDATISVRSSD